MTRFPFPHNDITRQQREARLKQRAFAVWFTGLPCSGKTTLATALQKRMHDQNFVTYMLDGDELRKGLCSDLGYSLDDRTENIRRAAEASKLLIRAGVITLNCFITPTKALRGMAKGIVGVDDFIEVFVKCPLEICEQRDVKGMYRKARNGELENFTGVSAPFEESDDANVVMDTSRLTVEQCVDELFDVAMSRAALNNS
jgi:adenylylsulfate kinase